MIVFLDLDGTLTDTAHERFKPFKDGLEETILNNIPVFNGAKQFILNLKNSGHKPIILSDSHPKYVNKIAQQIFQIPAISLTDKPNVEKTLYYINSNPELSPFIEDKDNFMIVGDSWLDIEIGRRLSIRTVLTQFYNASSIEERDGIGQDWKPIKMGPTYYAKNYEELYSIIQNPIGNLLAIEAIFQNQNSSKAVKFLHRPYSDGFATFRCLARQEDGECDKYAKADKYYQIDNPNRSDVFLNSLAKATSNYLDEVACYQNFHWDYFTYVSDKKTTTPPNKMKEIFDLVNTSFTKIKLFEWNENVIGKLRNQPNYEARRKFIANNLYIINEIELKGKRIIVLDDQFTSSATANEICSQLRNKGVKNILFIALFYLILPIESKVCPNCGKPLKIKIRKNDGNRFYSCLPQQFGGLGCGYTKNIV
jgi:phosphoglycolate phosphatase-like HAD superfamily hydrolase